MQSDKQWVEKTYEEIDAERGPVAYWVMRARHPSQRWRQVSRVRRRPTFEETYDELCTAAANVSEPYVEVLAFTARGRQPESTKSPWTTNTSAGDAGAVALGEVDELDVEGDTSTVALRFARAAMRDSSNAAHAVVQLMAKQVEHARGEADYWRQAAMELMQANGGKLPPTIEQVERTDRPALASDVMVGLQALSTTVIGSMMTGPDGPVREAVRAWFASLDREQLQAIAGVLRPTQAHALLAIAAMVEGRKPPAPVDADVDEHEVESTVELVE